MAWAAPTPWPESLVGSFDKHILTKGKREFETEVRRRTALVEERGLVGFADYRVPHDLSYENNLSYLEKVRDLWHGINPRAFCNLAGVEAELAKKQS